MPDGCTLVMSELKLRPLKNPEPNEVERAAGAALRAGGLLKWGTAVLCPDREDPCEILGPSSFSLHLVDGKM